MRASASVAGLFHIEYVSLTVVVNYSRRLMAILRDTDYVGPQDERPGGSEVIGYTALPSPIKKFEKEAFFERIHE